MIKSLVALCPRESYISLRNGSDDSRFFVLTKNGDLYGTGQVENK
jgi:hypothetical protein